MIAFLFYSLRAMRGYGLVLVVISCIAAHSYVQSRSGQGWASATSAPKRSAPRKQTQARQELFSARCGICHGRDAAGGSELRPNLIASVLVAQDVQGDKIGPVVWSGRPDKGIPSFNLNNDELTAFVAFVHHRETKGTEMYTVTARRSSDRRTDSRGSTGQSERQQGETRHDSASPALTEETRKERSQTAQAAYQSPSSRAYPPDQIQAGKTLFAAQCSFCHGRDAGGGESGPDLMASALVEQDVHGEKIGEVVRNGRLGKGMPAFDHVDEQQLAALVAFIYDRKAKAKEGRRRTVDVSDLQTGNAEAGMRYFNGAGGCAKCHSPSGDLAGIAGKLQGLELLKRMLYRENGRAAESSPGDGRLAGPSKAMPTATVTLPSGETVTGKLAYRDEFTIALTDPSGWYRSWPVTRVKFTVMNPLDAHIEQLGKYTDEDMHNVLAYLQTLR